MIASSVIFCTLHFLHIKLFTYKNHFLHINSSKWFPTFTRNTAAYINPSLCTLFFSLDEVDEFLASFAIRLTTSIWMGGIKLDFIPRL